MAAGGASLLAVAVFSMLIMSSLGSPRPLCSDCATLCSSNCTAEAQTSCSGYCNYSPQQGCQRQDFQGCTADGTCCSTNGTCTCDCNTVAQNGCQGVTDNYTDCEACKRAVYEQSCYPTCNNNCEKKCKKKGCHAA